jgi:hypothetical protein
MMKKKIFPGAVRLAKGAALFWGSALTAAVVLGVVTTALAAVPGDPLRLGQLNVIDGAATVLTGNNPNATTLDVANTATDPNARALQLKVAPGNAPLVVEPSAGTASNLSADKLDGKDSTAFANGTNGKANDADRLDGKDSTAFANGTNGKANDADRLDGKDSQAFWSGKSYETEKIGQGIGGGNPLFIDASCDPGDKVMNVGGGLIDDDQDELVRLEATGDSGGRATMQDNGGGGPFSRSFVQLVCADFPPLRP